MPERRYSDEEVAEIFARATEVRHGALPAVRAADGPTLADLQAIGTEAGIAPELVARAAHSLDGPRPPSSSTFLGLPLGVASTVPLQRRLTDAEWERFVVDLRETFEARGLTRAEGSLRSWSNGNLQVLLEPHGEGHRIRFRTLNGAARSLMYAGLGVVGVAVASAIAAVSAGVGAGEAVSSIGSLAIVGAGVFGMGALRLPGWARRRRDQMQALAERVQQLASEPVEPGA